MFRPFHPNISTSHSPSSLKYKPSKGRLILIYLTHQSIHHLKPRKPSTETPTGLQNHRNPNSTMIAYTTTLVAALASLSSVYAVTLVSSLDLVASCSTLTLYSSMSIQAVSPTLMPTQPNNPSAKLTQRTFPPTKSSSRRAWTATHTHLVAPFRPASTPPGKMSIGVQTTVCTVPATLVCRSRIHFYKIPLHDYRISMLEEAR